MEFQLAKYKGKWSVYAVKSNTFHYIGCGKKFCEKKVKELNNSEEK